MLKRFIRYLYEYENGRRMRNVGFVKVDQSDGECIVHIHGKGLRLEGEKELTIYLFYEKEKECIGLPQGTVENVNPAVNYQLRYTKEDVGEPGNYDRIEGIIMENSSHRKYAAVWDDMPVNVNEMRLWTPADLTEGSGEEERVEERPETEEPAEGRMSEPAPQREEAEEEMPAGNEAEEESENFPPEEEIPAEMEASEEEENAEYAGAEESECEESECEESEYEESETEEESVRTEQVETVEEAEIEEAECRSRTACGPCRQAQPVRPKPVCREQEKKCTKIQRQDIVNLPRCEWRLSNNSFLLHGYYNYHHLVLIEEDGNMWLGVPGIYHPKEAKAAEAFGFPQFIKAEKIDVDLEEEERNDGEDFGYWCRHIRR